MRTTNDRSKGLKWQKSTKLCYHLKTTREIPLYSLIEILNRKRHNFCEKELLWEELLIRVCKSTVAHCKNWHKLPPPSVHTVWLSPPTLTHWLWAGPRTCSSQALVNVTQTNVWQVLCAEASPLAALGNPATATWWTRPAYSAHNEPFLPGHPLRPSWLWAKCQPDEWDCPRPSSPRRPSPD